METTRLKLILSGQSPHVNHDYGRSGISSLPAGLGPPDLPLPKHHVRSLHAAHNYYDVSFAFHPKFFIVMTFKFSKHPGYKTENTFQYTRSRSIDRFGLSYSSSTSSSLLSRGWSWTFHPPASIFQGLIAGISHKHLAYVMLQTQHRASYLLGKYSAIWAPSPVPIGCCSRQPVYAD